VQASRHETNRVARSETARRVSRVSPANQRDK
jgi:hypothetical protein